MAVLGSDGRLNLNFGVVVAGFGACTLLRVFRLASGRGEHVAFALLRTLWETADCDGDREATCRPLQDANSLGARSIQFRLHGAIFPCEMNPV